MHTLSRYEAAATLRAEWQEVKLKATELLELINAADDGHEWHWAHNGVFAKELGATLAKAELAFEDDTVLDARAPMEDVQKATARLWRMHKAM